MIKKQYVSYGRVSQRFDPKKGRTHQSFKDECDINVLLQHWLKTGVMPAFNQRQPLYGDVSEMPGFADSMHLVALAEQQFALLSQEEQDQFNNDPMQYLEAVYEASDEVGTVDPLDVTVPTDSPTSSSVRKEDTDGVPQEDAQTKV